MVKRGDTITNGEELCHILGEKVTKMATMRMASEYVQETQRASWDIVPCDGIVFEGPKGKNIDIQPALVTTKAVVTPEAVVSETYLE